MSSQEAEEFAAGVVSGHHGRFPGLVFHGIADKVDDHCVYVGPLQDNCLALQEQIRQVIADRYDAYKAHRGKSEPVIMCEEP